MRLGLTGGVATNGSGGLSVEYVPDLGNQFSSERGKVTGDIRRNQEVDSLLMNSSTGLEIREE